ncbi:MAG: TonB family protein [Halothiobacillus sp.]|nr:TonB family protein [Halothiobacillus sp.]
MSPSRTGFVISALLHAALVGVGLYFWLKPTPQTDGSKEVVVPVSLASFAPVTPKPTPQPAEPAQKPTIKPEPEPKEDEPLTPPPVAQPEAEQIQKPELKPEPKPEPKPEQKNVPKSVSKPRPNPTHQPAPPKPPAPKVHKTPAAPHPTASAPSQQPSTDQQSKKQIKITPKQTQALPTPAGPTPDERDQIRLQYQSALAEAIEREKFYPSLARRLNQEGMIRVGFTVLADGRITNIHLVEPSAATALNQGAIEAIKRVGQFKPIPPALGMQSMDLNISLIYKLR